MKWIEVIDLYSSRGKVDEIIASRYLDINQPDNDEASAKVEVFRNHAKPWHLSVHLTRQSKKPRTFESILGLIIRKALKKHGRVSYSVWVKLKKVTAFQLLTTAAAQTGWPAKKEKPI